MPEDASTASIFAKDGSGIVRIEVAPGTDGAAGKLTVSSRAEELGDNTGDITADVEGGDGKIAFNSKYLSDVLGVLSEEKVALEMTTSSSPGVIRRDAGAPKAAAKKRRTRTTITRAAARRTNNWGVQLGAFYQYAPAHLAATRAVRVVPGLMRTRVSIVASAGRRRTLYRARLLDMSERKARRACARLKRKKMDCLVLRNGDTVSKARR